MCGSRRRRPMTSPPGGGMAARPKRASSGPASRNEARMRSACSRSTVASRSTPAAQMTTSLSSRHSALAPRPRSTSSIASTSRMRGTLRTTTSSEVSTEAARMGRAPFLFPAGTTVPESGTPPSMTNFSMGAAARLTAMSPLPSRDEAWALLTSWVASESLRRHCLAVEAAMRHEAADRGEDEDLWGLTGLLHHLDYERYPDAETGHPRMALAELE